MKTKLLKLRNILLLNSIIIKSALYKFRQDTAEFSIGNGLWSYIPPQYNSKPVFTG